MKTHCSYERNLGSCTKKSWRTKKTITLEDLERSLTCEDTGELVWRQIESLLPEQ